MSEPTLADRLCVLLRDQQASWKRGERVPVEEYLTRQPSLAGHAGAVLDLIANEIQLRQEAGLELQVLGADHWHDYRTTDCVLAVRSFDSRPHLRKPSTKLYNSWLAGVPFVGGMDSAYQADGEAGTNYLATGSLGELDRELRRLAADKELRQRLADAGRQQSESFTRTAIRQRWAELITSRLPAAAEEWRRRSAASKRIYSLSQAAIAWLDRRRRA